MKFSEIPYIRPDYPSLAKKLDALTLRLQASATAAEQLSLYREMEELDAAVSTQTTLCAIRNTIDTRDPFYDAEQAFNDEQLPLLLEKLQDFSKTLVRSPVRAELEQELGSLLFRNLEMELRSFSPEIVPLMQEENRLATEYQKLYASAQIPFDGKTLTIAQLGPYKESPDRTVRRAAQEASGKFFDEHREQLDSLFDQLVKNRTEQAKKLGFANFVELGALRRRRNCYSAKDLARFRDLVVRDLVPLTEKIKHRQAERIGVSDFKFHDDAYKFKDGSPTPQGTAEDIMAAGKKMYTELSPETAEFIRQMFDMELFDMLAKEGKAPGGYCTSLEAYDCCFIFSNFDGTAGDVDVFTHEAGHAFADYTAARTIPVHALRFPTMDGAETHSMSMEFLTAPWHSLFFGPDTAKYELSHMEDALTFIPYGCLVDHFQTEVYSKPELTPEQRNELWLSLEKRYRPYMDFDGLPFFARGAGWQRQIHIYSSPFYYIDYCLAQVMALQFFSLSLQDREAAWQKYLNFAKLGGTKTFVELVESAALQSPLQEGCLKDICDTAAQWMEENLVE